MDKEVSMNDTSLQPHRTVSTNSFMEPGLLDETVEVLKKRAWSLRSAWKGIAEVLCRYTVSPTVLGYSSVSICEDGYVKDIGEDVKALEKAKACTTTLSRQHSSNSIPEEDTLLVEGEPEEEDVDHAFAESMKRDHDEEASLTKLAR